MLGIDGAKSADVRLLACSVKSELMADMSSSSFCHAHPSLQSTRHSRGVEGADSATSVPVRKTNSTIVCEGRLNVIRARPQDYTVSPGNTFCDVLMLCNRKSGHVMLLHAILSARHLSFNVKERALTMHLVCNWLASVLQGGTQSLH